MPTLNFGPKALRFAMRPPELDWPINILEGAFAAARPGAFIRKPSIAVSTRSPAQDHHWGLQTERLQQRSHRSVRNPGTAELQLQPNTGQLRLCDSTDWLVIGAKDEGSERYIRGLTVGVALCDEVSLMPQSFFQMLLSRMSPEGARLYGTTNPDSPYHWLEKLNISTIRS